MSESYTHLNPQFSPLFLYENSFVKPILKSKQKGFHNILEKHFEFWNGLNIQLKLIIFSIFVILMPAGKIFNPLILQYRNEVICWIGHLSGFLHTLQHIISPSFLYENSTVIPFLKLPWEGFQNKLAKYILSFGHGLNIDFKLSFFSVLSS